jgi:EAL domain-containing protein (putative c-di-GMP-specific phosphodiesterase class I)
MSANTNIFKKAALCDETGSYTEIIRSILIRQGIDSVQVCDATNPADVDIAIFILASASSNSPLLEKFMKIGIPVLLKQSGDMSDYGKKAFLDLISRLNYTGKLSLTDQDQADSLIPDIETYKNALANKEFELWYQPIVETKNGLVSGFESLIRWRKPESGEIIPPSKFIPVIENNDFIIPFTFWIVEEACNQIKKWQGKFGKDRPFIISVNLSAKQFTSETYVERIVDIIDSLGIDPTSLALEITESAFMEDMRKANLMLLTLRSKHIKIYLDDFGMGYSSLSYLLHFPVDTLKIDMSFVKWMHVDEQSEAIVRAISSLAHSLKMTVVAEGVEIKEHSDILKEIGCDYMQGYFYSKPLCSKDAEDFLMNSSSR